MDRRSLNVPLWGGIECTLARIGEDYVDQTRLTGHYDREDDVDRIASLGVRTLRYPVLWECEDRAWTDRRLGMLREAGIEPIATLLHHGSGPRGTDLLDDEFPKKFERYAEAVARRYPWLRYFTPINEPLTTARFSALYGVWYPHARDDASFLRALRNETEAIARAMRAIREVIPQAQFVQTEDLSKTYATPPLEDQAALENARRFAIFDLLCGRADPYSPFFAWAQRRGLCLDDAFLEKAYAPPDVIGLNYYVTSERFIDHRTACYPGVPAGGNERMAYVDVEAVRACAQGIAGPRHLLHEYWTRYRLPLALTEAHLGCTPEEQLRWVDEMYQQARALKRDGVDVRGFTVWSLFGAYDWDSLLVRRQGSYEPGAFDVRFGRPQETAVAQWMRAIAAGERFNHPALDREGWWHRPERLLYGPFDREGPALNFAARAKKRTVLVVGSSPFALRVAKACVARGLSVRSTAKAQIRAAVCEETPWLVIDGRTPPPDEDADSLLSAAIHAAALPHAGDRPSPVYGDAGHDVGNVIRIDSAVRDAQRVEQLPEDCA